MAKRKGTGGVDRNFYTLERRVLDEYKGDGPGFLVWAYLIGRANWRDGTVKFKGERRVIHRGQLLTSVAKIARHWGLHEDIVRRRLRELEAAGSISQESKTRGGRVITIVNYERYQNAKAADAGIGADLSDDKDSTNGDNGAAREGIAPESRGNDAACAPETRGNHAWNSAGIEYDVTVDNVVTINSNGAARAGNVRESCDTGRGASAETAREPRRLIEQVTSEQATRVQGNSNLPATAAAAPERPASAPTKSEIAAAQKAGKSRAVLEAYLGALRLMHGVTLAPNATLRSQACTLVDRIGAKDAPEVAEYFVTNEREAWVVRARHPFGELVKNWQKYYTNWQTGSKVSVGMARAVERNDANQTALERLLAKEKHAARPTNGG